MSRKRIVALALVILTASCGSTSKDESSATALTSSPATDTSPPSQTTSAEPADLDRPEPTPLLERLGIEASGDGWLLPSGRWTTARLGTPITFETSEEMSLIDDTDGLVELGPTGYTSDRFESVLLGRFAGTAAPAADDDVTYAALPDDLDTYLTNSERIDVVSSGPFDVAGEEVTWYEITANPSADFAFPCQYGDACTLVLDHELLGPFALGEPGSHRVRIAELPADPGGPRIIAWVRAPSERFEAFWSTSERLLSSLEYAGPSDYGTSPGDDETIQFSQADMGPLEAGLYEGKLTEATVKLTLGERLESVSFEHAIPGGILLFGTSPTDGEAFLGIAVKLGYYTPEEATSDHTSAPTAEQLIANDTDIGAHLATVRGLEIEDSGQATVGGQDAQWWQVRMAEDISEDSYYSCEWFGDGEKCIHLLATAMFDEIVGSSVTVRIYELEEYDIVMIVDASTVYFESWLEAVEPILEGLTIGD